MPNGKISGALQAARQAKLLYIPLTHPTTARRNDQAYRHCSDDLVLAEP